MMAGDRHMPLVRDARESDSASIADILAREIVDGVAHFGLRPPPVSQVLADFLARGVYPWVVAADTSGAVLGFARASAWKSREAYTWTAEIGVYVRPEHQRRGVGRALYARLFPSMQAAGLRTIIAGIALPNPASVRLHEAFAMTHVGSIPCAGFKHGRWIDVGYWVRHLGEGVPCPVSPTTFETTARD
ncbi:MAG: N-acetyltransferase [Phycisphaeraceae bacterium]|nr:N-acetyltransferase [Phycisphaeraceae bacterium]